MDEKEFIKEYINEIGKFIAVRDIEKLNKESLKEKYGIAKVKILILLGSSITYTIKCAVEAYDNGICEKILICGGIGHSTEILRNTIKSHPIYKDIKVEGKAEADIFKEVITKYYDISSEDIIIENKSTNCGDNAKKAIELLDNINMEYDSLILIQDPTMQLRSYLSFLKYLKGKDNITLINYAPFIPVLNNNIEITNTEVDGIWNLERYLELIMGEIPRLRDNEKGYGPKGANFIEHVDIPDNIKIAYEKLSSIVGNKYR